jgi:heteromeric Ino2p/Ino4p transcription factor
MCNKVCLAHLSYYDTEQKRRQAIRDGFDKLCELVPGLEGQGRSEGLVLNRTVEYMREQLEVRRRLVQEREARGEVVDEKLKEYEISPLIPPAALC